MNAEPVPLGAPTARRRRRFSSRRRLVGSIVGALLVVLLGFGFAAIIVVRDQLVHRIDRELLRSGASIQALITPEQLRELTAGSKVSASSEATILLDPQGRRVVEVAAGTQADRLPLPDLENFTPSDLRARSGRPFTRGAVGGSDLEYRVLVTPIGSEGDLLVSATPLNDVENTLKVLAKILLASAAAAVSVLAGLIWLVSRAALKPIDDMIDVAGAIGRGDLTARIGSDSNSAEVERLAGALNSMLAQLESAFADKEASEARLRRFAADASHELRTPLTTIQGWADLYHAGGSDSPDLTAQAMDRIGREASRMSLLVDDLLLLARLDRHRSLAADPVDLSAILRDSVADLRATEPRRPIVVEIPDEPVLVIGDGARLRQVMANLIANVSIHTDPDVAARITIVVEDGRATVTIRDEGPGMTEDDARQVFDRFYRPEHSRSRLSGGSGLGLAIVHSVVEAHGGSISLATSPGAGATFTISLPLRPSRSL